MNSLVKKYNGKKLSTDEVAVAQNAINKEIEALEGIKYESGPDHLLLKWGTLKSWGFHTKKAIDLLAEYESLGSNWSAISQRDNPRQKEIICELIDECDGSIQGDWTGEYFTKENAKKYVMGYDKDS